MKVGMVNHLHVSLLPTPPPFTSFQATASTAWCTPQPTHLVRNITPQHYTPTPQPTHLVRNITPQHHSHTSSIKASLNEQTFWHSYESHYILNVSLIPQQFQAKFENLQCDLLSQLLMFNYL
jgi:hypothetical protein